MSVCACVCVCDRVLDGEARRVFASRALVAAHTAVYLTAYIDCLTGFREPLFPPY